jgi:short-subunit dehydrogenase
VDETTPDEAVRMMASPYFATFNLTHAFLPGMMARNTGHILNVSSVASRFVWPGATAYIAARWAVRGFTEALRADLARTGIGVTLFECGVVASSYWEHNPGSLERVPRMGKLVPPVTPESAAQAILNGIRRNQKLVVTPFMMKVTYFQHALAPGVVQWLMTRTGYRRPTAGGSRTPGTPG